MSTHAVGFKPPDEKWRKMKAVWDACIAAKMGVPVEVERFFNGQRPDPAGVEVSERKLIEVGALVPLEPGNGQTRGFDLHVDKLPPDVKIVRFENSW